MGVPEGDRIEMSQRERDILKVMSGVLKGERTQAEAARLLKLSTRQLRRLQRKLEAAGDGHPSMTTAAEDGGSGVQRAA